VNFGINRVENSQKKDDQYQVVRNGLNELILLECIPYIEILNPYEHSIQHQKYYQVRYLDIAVDVFTPESQIAANQTKLDHLDINQEWVLI
jgi:hypothetical protein